MIALSLDGNDIVLGDDNKMVRVLDMHTGEFVSRPYEGHTKEIYSISLSQDSNPIDSGSLDCIIRV